MGVCLIPPSYPERVFGPRSAAAVILCLVSACGPAISRADAAPDFLERVLTAEDFDSIAAESLAPFADRITKFLLPASDDPDLLPALFQNVQIYRFHFEFLSLVFPDRFPGLTFEEYLLLVERRAAREYYAGTVTRYIGPGPVSYGFTIFTDGLDPDELLEPEEMLEIYQRLRAIFTPRPLEYAPQRVAAILKAQTWENPGFPIRFASSRREVIGYSLATNYGRVRILTLGELAATQDAGELDWQTIVVVDEAPPDIEGVVAGVITGSEQGDLSHLAIRLARRGVPNVFVSDARNAFQGLDGEMVRLAVESGGYTVHEATLEEAEAWWVAHRPSVPPIPEVDASYDDFDGLTEMDVENAARRAIARFGGKASNLAILYRHLPSAHRVPGFAIPFSYYLEFMRSNTIPRLDDPSTEDSYEKHIHDLLEDPRFRADGAFRRSALDRLRDHARQHGVVPEELLGGIRERLLEVFGDPAPKVRFRSSSNAEDSLEFSGAGLYDSTSVCMADELDGDDQGPSRCDDSKGKERTIRRGLRKVWMSLWNVRAFEERDYFQIAHRRAAMAVLVTLAFPDEDSNGVAFTGNPSNREDRNFVVNVQLGDESVVAPGVGQAEKDLLVMDGERVARAILVRPSSLAVPEQRVLSEAQLSLLGTTMAQVEGPFRSHFDLGGHSEQNVLVDFEFKFQDGELLIKQARLFLLTDSVPDGTVFVLEVPAGARICGQFQDDRSADLEYLLKSQIELTEGRFELATRSGYTAVNLIDRLELGPARVLLEPLNSGVFNVADRGPTWTTWHFDQDFDVEGERFRITADWTLHQRNDADENRVLVLDDTFFAHPPQFVAGTRLRAEDAGELVVYRSCTYGTLPLWDVSVQFAGGEWARFLERSQVTLLRSGLAALVEGEAFLGGELRKESSYWRLVYAAGQHNRPEHFRMIFAPPITVGATPGVAALHVQEGTGSPHRASLLDESFSVLRKLDVVSYEQTLLTPIFQRGDVNVDGKADLSDIVFALDYLFGGATDPSCLKSADFNDSGVLDLADPVFLLNHLFAGGNSPGSPVGTCGIDGTDDNLSCEAFENCFWEGRNQP